MWFLFMLNFPFLSSQEYRSFFFIMKVLIFLVLNLCNRGLIIASSLPQTRRSSSVSKVGRSSISSSITKPQSHVSRWHHFTENFPYLIEKRYLSLGSSFIDDLIVKHVNQYNSKPKLREKTMGSRISLDELSAKTGLSMDVLSKTLPRYYDSKNLIWKSGKEDGSSRLTVYGSKDKNLKFKYVYDPELKKLLLYKKSEVSQISTDLDRGLNELIPNILTGLRTSNSYAELLPKSLENQKIKLKSVEYVNKDGGFDQAYMSAKITGTPVLAKNDYGYFSVNRYLKSYVTDRILGDHQIAAKVKFRVNTDDGIANTNDGTLFSGEVSHLGLGGVKFKPYEISSTGDKISLGFLGRYNHEKDQGKLSLGIKDLQYKVMDSKALERKTKYVYSAENPDMVNLLKHIETNGKENVRAVPKPSKEDLILHAENVLKDRYEHIDSPKSTTQSQRNEIVMNHKNKMAIGIGISSLALASIATAAANSPKAEGTQ